MGDNVRQMQDIIDYTARFNIPDLTLFLDF